MKNKIDLSGLYIDESIKGKVYAEFEDFYKDYKRQLNFLYSYLEVSNLVRNICIGLCVIIYVSLIAVLIMLSKLENYNNCDALLYVSSMIIVIISLVAINHLSKYQAKRDKHLSLIRKYHFLLFFRNTSLDLEKPASYDTVISQSKAFRDSKTGYLAHFENAFSVSFSVIVGCYAGIKYQGAANNPLVIFIIIFCIYSLISLFFKYSRHIFNKDYRRCLMLEKDLSEIKWLIETEKIPSYKLANFYEKEIRRLYQN